MSTKNILNPVPTGGWISVPFYPGCRYVATRGYDSREVRIIDKNS